jgi:hypothetical protein
MRAAAIPKRFLPHSCTLVTETDNAHWGSTVTVETELNHVRIDLSENNALLFYDCLNSTPANVNFTLSGGNIKRLRVIAFEKEYVIKKVDYLYAEDSLLRLSIIWSKNFKKLGGDKNGGFFWYFAVERCVTVNFKKSAAKTII